MHLPARKELVSLMAQVAGADPSAPLEKQSVRHRVLTHFRHDLGDLIARPAVHELHSIGPKIRCPLYNHRLPTEPEGEEQKDQRPTSDRTFEAP